MSNGAIDSARRATLPTKFATNRAAQQSAQAAQKKWAVSTGKQRQQQQQRSPLKGHEGASPIVNSATNTAPIYARVGTVLCIKYLYTVYVQCGVYIS